MLLLAPNCGSPVEPEQAQRVWSAARLLVHRLTASVAYSMAGTASYTRVLLVSTVVGPTRSSRPFRTLHHPTRHLVDLSHD